MSSLYRMMSASFQRPYCSESEDYQKADQAFEEARSQASRLNANAYETLTSPEIRNLPENEKRALWQTYYDSMESMDQVEKYAMDQMVAIVEKTRCQWSKAFMWHLGSNSGFDSEQSKKLIEWRRFLLGKPASQWNILSPQKIKLGET